nr:Chain B, ALA-PRO-PRO-LEU-PRO-PRO-ARG-ASN-ARG-PRO-ARG-LEU [unidentified]4ZNX_E Chain E, APP12 [synthetic construct]4ZNX_F Chain F, APP12 [synthetic construct]4ZNX_G Chain G, APP12 [synthetic construct]4ZNX_H Chain H, APP12 [synthetic construct]
APPLPPRNRPRL